MKSLFLKWVVINVMTLVLIGLGLWYSWPVIAGLNLVGKGLIIFISFIFISLSGKGGLICWQIEADAEYLVDCNEEELAKTRKHLRELRREAGHIEFWAHACPYWAFLGALSGFMIIGYGALHATDASRLQETSQTLINGIGVGFMPTIFGVYFLLLLSLEYHYIVYRINWLLAEE